MNRYFICAVLLAAACTRNDAAGPAQGLEDDATSIARFLSGHARFDAFQVADSVDLLVAPDGGGGRARLSRDQLRDPVAWKVESGGRTRSFVPRGLSTRLVTSPGQYMNCQPSELRTRFPNLAAYPHVGVRLEPPRVRSCLETWNATFVFDTTGGRRRLIAAVYDQWEW